ncbi:MAG TPA: oxygen-independent coproporphyrinogen III oxidase [Bacteroidales bacterium]|nr:oxygen-independent coproporphyrinogen III oxidase [Bacteroidales bacterium]
MKIPKPLLDKYNVPVPRYTSYPPANHFTDAFGESEYVSMLKSSNSCEPRNIALYIHIPFCEKICFYCGCNAYPKGNENQVSAYMNAVKREIELVSQHIDTTRQVSQIHYGGGTPNSIDSSYIKELNEFLFSKFRFIDEPEIAIECNPAYLDFKYIDVLKDAGFNRFSLGIQDFNQDTLRKVNREPSSIPPAELFRYLKSSEKKTGVNFDFIYGLPGQTIASFTRTMQIAAGIKPDRLVTFSYAHVPWVKKHQLILEKRGLPTAEDKTEMFLAACDLLAEKGYKQIGLDHFVLPSDELWTSLQTGMLHRNFQGYCTRNTTGQVYAFGVTAISQLDGGYAQNRKEIDAYISDIRSGKLPVERGYELNINEKVAREAITTLMCNKRLNFNDLSPALNVSDELVRSSLRIEDQALAALQQDGLIDYSDGEIRVSETGSFFIRNIAASIDKAYTEKVQTYSKPV